MAPQGRLTLKRELICSKPRYPTDLWLSMTGPAPGFACPDSAMAAEYTPRHKNSPNTAHRCYGCSQTTASSLQSSPIHIPCSWVVSFLIDPAFLWRLLSTGVLNAGYLKTKAPNRPHGVAAQHMEIGVWCALTCGHVSSRHNPAGLVGGYVFDWVLMGDSNPPFFSTGP